MLVCRTELDRNLDRALGRAFGDLAHFTRGPVPRSIPLDLFETDSNFVLRADVPGVDKEQLDITLEENRLTISGSRTLPEDEASRSFLRERGTRDFKRSFELPSPVDPDGVAARLTNGVLEVMVPKIPEPAPRRIDIAVS